MQCTKHIGRAFLFMVGRSSNLTRNSLYRISALGVEGGAWCFFLEVALGRKAPFSVYKAGVISILQGLFI